MRKVPERRAAPLAPVVRVHPTRHVWERSYRFITPVFGGGVKVDDHRKPYDRVTPVRASAIRGQLRFWWRAVNPRRCETVEALAQSEAEVFGLASDGEPRNTPVSVVVTKQPERYAEVKPLKDNDKFGVNEGFLSIAYGAFPLRDPTPALRHGVLHEFTDDWTINLSVAAETQRDIEAALWAWTQFGGLGGRTRRGFGAIELRGAANGPALMSATEGWSHWKLADAPRVAWPHLRGDALDMLGAAAGVATGLAAQKVLLEKLRDLRQGVGVGRNPGQEPKRPGRSRWPEADAIRVLAKKHHPDHAPTSSLASDAFPRAVFGAPIIFHFKDGGHSHRNDPQDSTLNPEGHGRLASPLILRPAFESGSYLPRAVRLRGSVPSRFALTGGASATGLRVFLDADEFARIKPLAGEHDPITRYLNLLRNGR